MRARRRFDRTVTIPGVGRVVALLALGALGCGGESQLEAPALDEPAQPVVSTLVTGGHEYLFYQSPRNWTNAASICPTGGTYHVVEISNAAENAFVTGQAAQHGGGAWWIGYVRPFGVNPWVWQGNYPNAFENWNAGEPNNAGGLENCATVDAATGKWNDLNCSTPLNFICERDAGQVLTPDHSKLFNLDETNSAQRLYMDIPIFLKANQGLTFGTCGVLDGSVVGDSFLRFIGPNGALLALNDDACVSLGSNISYVAPVAGTYRMRVGCFDNDACHGEVAWRTEPL